MLQEEEEEERALDLQMEIDRLRALEAYEERERQRMAESRVGAQILNEQIVERNRERVHQEELRDLVCLHLCPLVLQATALGGMKSLQPMCKDTGYAFPCTAVMHTLPVCVQGCAFM